MRQHFRSSWPAHRAAPRSRPCPEISAPGRRLAALTALIAGVPFAAWAASPSPHPSSTPQHPNRIDVTKVQPKSLLPKKPEHTDYTVEINKLGQVTRITSQHRSDNATFNAQTYGNALQTFIRTPDGHVVLGTYRLTYDYDPKTTRVRRDVSLVRQGGVNPDAKGAAAELIEHANLHPVEPPNPQSSVDPRSLPDLKGITVPTPAPSPS
jgi:hypothetical protein